jgi:hypothetical protein
MGGKVVGGPFWYFLGSRLPQWMNPISSVVERSGWNGIVLVFCVRKRPRVGKSVRFEGMKIGIFCIHGGVIIKPKSSSSTTNLTKSTPLNPCLSRTHSQIYPTTINNSSFNPILIAAITKSTHKNVNKQMIFIVNSQPQQHFHPTPISHNIAHIP